MHAREEFEDNFTALFGLAYQAAYRILGDRHRAEEIAAETLIRAWAKWPSVCPSPIPWVVHASGCLAIDEWRKLHRRLRPTEPVSPSTHGDHSAERIDLQRSLARLPRRQREVAVMRFLADLTESEVATTLHISRGAVKQHAHRAIVGLRRLQDDDPNPTTDRKASNG